MKKHVSFGEARFYTMKVIIRKEFLGILFPVQGHPNCWNNALCQLIGLAAIVDFKWFGVGVNGLTCPTSLFTDKIFLTSLL